jgi:hemoglobin
MTDPSAERRPSPVTLRSSENGQAAVGNFWAEIGGRPTFERLVRAFYAGVASDPPLLALYPETDLEPAIQRLTGFLEQYWGGPTTYSQERGHPRLRMRHAPFAIGTVERDAWLRHMRDAVDSLDLTPEQDATLWGYLEMAALSMQNRFPDEADGDLSP